jgi:hypothetical protein
MLRSDSPVVPDRLGTPGLRSVVGMTEGRDREPGKARKCSLQGSA